jgi:hypothetical protein
MRRLDQGGQNSLRKPQRPEEIRKLGAFRFAIEGAKQDETRIPTKIKHLLIGSDCR